jgi:hypothetical protein
MQIHAVSIRPDQPIDAGTVNARDQIDSTAQAPNR